MILRTTENRKALSANSFACITRLSGKSLMSIKNSNGPRIVPCGTPVSAFEHDED